jgi:hypothetical protein
VKLDLHQNENTLKMTEDIQNKLCLISNVLSSHDLKDFEEWRDSTFILIDRNLAIKQAFLAGRRTLSEKDGF